MNTLNLTLKKKWFDMIASGEKKEEYREIKDYWAVRLLYFNEEMEWGCYDEMLSDMRSSERRHKDIAECLKYFNVEFKPFDIVSFRNGYRKDSPLITKKHVKTTIGIGRPEWGAPEGKEVFIIELG